MSVFLQNHPVFRLLPFQILAILFFSQFNLPFAWLFGLLILFSTILYTRYYGFVIPLILLLIMGMRVQQTNIDIIEYDNEKDYKIISIIDDIKQKQNSINYELRIINNPTKLLLRSNDSLNVIPSDTLILKCKLERPSVARNPGAFDYRKFLERKGISHFVSKGYEIIEVRENDSWNVSATFYKIRQNIIQKIHNYIGKPYSGLMTGLLLGEKGEIHPEIFQRFQQIGVVHILAVSGLHLGYILIILMSLSVVFRLNDLLKMLFIIFGLLFYMALTGFPTSVVRAGMMAILYIVGKYRNKILHPWNILGVVGFVILLWNPSQLFDLGFQLSFGAVAGILYLHPQIDKLQEKSKIVRRIRARKVSRWIFDLSFVSLGAQVGTFLPISLTFFAIPVWAVFGNLFAVPLAGISVIAGLITLFADMISTSLASIYGNSGWLLLRGLDYISFGLEQLPQSKMMIGGISFVNLILILVFIIIICSFGYSNYRKRVLFAGLIITNIYIWQMIFINPPVQFTFLDVGQGDACIIEDGNHTILIDAGYCGFGKDYGKWVILPYLKYRGISKIDLAIMSHPHADHIGGFKTLVNEVDIGQVWDTHNDYQSKLYENILKKLNRDRIQIHIPKPGEIYELGELKFTILYPDSLHSVNARNINNASLVLRIDHRGNSFLFTGDAEEKAEKVYRKLGESIDVDVIKVGHHGSKTSSSQQIVDLCSAEIGIISCGKKNKFGHPSQMIIDRWENSGTIIYRTDKNGAVIVESKEESLELKVIIDEVVVKRK